jgi:hypothetical protein
MLNAAGEQARPVIPQLIIPIKNALNTKNPGVIAATLRIIQHLCMCGESARTSDIRVGISFRLSLHMSPR